MSMFNLNKKKTTLNARYSTVSLKAEYFIVSLKTLKVEYSIVSLKTLKADYSIDSLKTLKT